MTDIHFPRVYKMTQKEKKHITNLPYSAYDGPMCTVNKEGLCGIDSVVLSFYTTPNPLSPKKCFMDFVIGQFSWPK